jgi:pyruvate/2-oxoglutarate dehydrogenase complex dihydrolipoamide dehydrogenase (E3) component
MPSEDPEVGDSAESALNKRGVRVHTSANIIHISGGNNRKVITFEQDGQQHHVAVEEILVAAGKLPNIDFGLDNTGLRYNELGINVNRFMQTKQKHIFAAGSVVGASFTTHTSIQESRVAEHNMYHRKKIAMDYSAIPRIYSGSPEIAAVGTTEWQMLLTGEIFQTSIAPIGMLGRAISSNWDQGFVKIIANHNGVLLGASIVAPHASEMLPELTFAIQHHHHACAIANTVHAFPTWSEAIRIAASKIKCI